MTLFVAALHKVCHLLIITLTTVSSFVQVVILILNVMVDLYFIRIFFIILSSWRIKFIFDKQSILGRQIKTEYCNCLIAAVEIAAVVKDALPVLLTSIVTFSLYFSNESYHRKHEKLLTLKTLNGHTSIYLFSYLGGREVTLKTEAREVLRSINSTALTMILCLLFLLCCVCGFSPKSFIKIQT